MVGKRKSNKNYGRNKSSTACRKIERKRRAIMECLASDPVDLETLRSLAFTTNGFLSDDMRRRIWPKLLDINRFTADVASSFIKPHRSDHQVQKDIDRSLWHYDIVQDMSSNTREMKRKVLYNMINAILVRNVELDLHYYQGFHDVCSVFLLTMGKKEAFVLAERVSISYFREAMRPGFENVIQVIQLLFPLIRLEDSELDDWLHASTVEPYVILPWIITWFAHHLNTFSDVTRLYDAFLVSHPLFPLYCSAALIIMHKESIMEQECDFGMVHQYISSLVEKMDIEKMLLKARGLLVCFPPEMLRKQITLDLPSDCTYFTYPFWYQNIKQDPDRLLFKAVQHHKARQAPPPRKPIEKPQQKMSPIMLFAAGAVLTSAYITTWWMKVSSA